MKEGLGRLDYAKPIFESRGKGGSLMLQNTRLVSSVLRAAGRQSGSVVLELYFSSRLTGLGGCGEGHRVEREVSARQRLKRRLRQGAKEGWNSGR